MLLSHASELITLWQDDPRGAHRVRQDYFSERRYLGSKDRRSISEIYYDVIRNLRLYVWSFRNNFPDEKDIPGAYLAVHSFKMLYTDHILEVEFKIDDAISLWYAKDRSALAFPDDPAIRWSVPDFMYNSLVEHYDEKTALDICKASMKNPGVHIRCNQTKTNRESLKRALQDYHPGNGRLAPLALRFRDRNDLKNSPAAKRGHFEFQDESSQLAAYVCNPRRTDTVVDICAGGGGKSLHLADLMENKGHILSSDIATGKLQELKRRQKTAGFTNIRTMSITDIIKRFRSVTDVLLIDAPCSGSGTYGRNAHSKWDVDEEGFKDLLSVQAEILDAYAPLVTLGGYIVYVTCSVCDEENSQQVDHFLKRHPEFERVSAYTTLRRFGIDLKTRYHQKDVVILPQDYESIGFFVSKIQRVK